MKTTNDIHPSAEGASATQTPASGASQPPAQNQAHRSPLTAGLIGGVIGAVLHAAISLSAGWYLFIKPMQERLQQTPPVVVVDFVRLAQQYPEGASAEEVEKLMRKTNAALLKLRDAGYVVLDAQAVLAAPDELLVTSELLQ
ncbi:MAG: hypothetical protein E7K47_04955 [Acidovorax sp.]|jgi:uncharacterized protein HemX|nr:hypothetical protein [Acidovorax sp.]TFI42373.1 hypothetical protein E4O93_22370 [Diaphorobacter sp. DS2]